MLSPGLIKTLTSIYRAGVLGMALMAQPAESRLPESLGSTTQIVVVTTSDWTAVEGTLRRFERSGPRQAWVSSGEPVAVVVGKAGLGWGAGLASIQQARQASDPVKKEGDGKAPAGVFALSRTFGYDPERLPGSKMTYVPLTPTIECVDDAASRFYNQVVDRTSVAVDWSSSERMLRSDELYRWGIVVDHNRHPAQPGAGSCIFLHIWRGPGQGTVGCTAMPRETLEALLGWLDPARGPLLVQLPEREYEALMKDWGLPARPGAAMPAK